MRAPFFRRSRLGRRAATALLLMLVTGASLSRSSSAGEAAPPSSAASLATAAPLANAAPLATAGDAVASPCAIFGGSRPLALIPPPLLADRGPASAANPLHHLQLAAPNPTPRNLHVAPTGPVLLSVDLSLRYLRLAVHGDYRAGLLPFLGTSTTSLGGLRLRF